MSYATKVQEFAAGEIPVVALLRVSSAEQGSDDRGGLPRQREVVNRTIATKNLNCIDWIELVDVSGTNTSTHPQIREVLRRILNGEVRGLVVADIDRLFRPTEPANFAMLQVFKDVGAKIYSGDFEYDLTTKDGMLFSSIRSAFAGFELNLMKERQMGACEAKRKAGKCPTNHLTLPHGIGYNRKSESWHFTPEIAQVKEIFDLFAGGLHNYSELGRRIGLGAASVKVILKNPVYTGYRVVSSRRGNEKRVSKSGKVYRVKVARRPDEVIRVKVLDGIITEKFHAQVLVEMKRLKYNHNSALAKVKSVHLGASLCVCGHCGLSLFHVWNKKAGRYICKSQYYLYRDRYSGGCKQSSIRAEELDAAIDSFVAGILRSPAHLSRILEASLAKTREVVTDFPAVVSPKEQIAELRKRDARILDAYEKGAIDVDELRQKRESIRREIDAFTRMQEPRRVNEGTDFDKLARIIVKAAFRYPKIDDLPRKQQIIRGIFSEIHVRDKQIISFRFQPSLVQGNLTDPAGADKAILLPKLFQVGLPPDTMPEGHKRCIKCTEVKLDSEFYRNLNSCHPCRAKDERARHLRRIAEVAKAVQVNDRIKKSSQPPVCQVV